MKFIEEFNNKEIFRGDCCIVSHNQKYYIISSINSGIGINRLQHLVKFDSETLAFEWDNDKKEVVELDGDWNKICGGVGKSREEVIKELKNILVNDEVKK